MAKLVEYSKKFGNQDIVEKPKKFVFQIFPENIDYIESLTYQEKQDFINGLISEYRDRENKYYQDEADYSRLKKIIIYALSIIVGIPLLLIMINFSLDITKNSYLDMQRKFEKLYTK